MANELGSIASRVRAGVNDVVGRDWVARGADGLESRARLLTTDLDGARSALEQASGALSTYAAMLGLAQETAQAAQVAVDDANATASAMLMARGAADSAAGAAASAAQVSAETATAAMAAPGSPTALGQATQAQAASDQANAAHRQARTNLARVTARYDSERARALALQAESAHQADAAAVRAAAAFDAVSAQAPAVRAAIAAAQARAVAGTRRAHEGNPLLGVAQMLAGAFLGSIDIAALAANASEDKTDAQDNAATVKFGERAVQVGEEGFANLSGSTATTAELQSAEAAATRQVVVDGQHLDSSVLADTEHTQAPGADRAGLGAVAGTGGNATAARLTPSDLPGAIRSNYGRFFKSLPSRADQPIISPVGHGSIQFDAKVPATSIPGSFATYTKVVDNEGNTVTFFKTTYAPDGSVVHVKVKYP